MTEEGGTSFILRFKEQETHLILHAHDDVLLLGLQWGDIAACVQWMAAFVYIVREEGQTQVTAAVRQGTASSDTNTGSGLLKSMPHVVVDDSHNIQTHVVDLQMLVSNACPYSDAKTCKTRSV